MNFTSSRRVDALPQPRVHAGLGDEPGRGSDRELGLADLAQDRVRDLGLRRDQHRQRRRPRTAATAPVLMIWYTAVRIGGTALASPSSGPSASTPVGIPSAVGAIDSFARVPGGAELHGERQAEHGLEREPAAQRLQPVAEAARDDRRRVDRAAAARDRPVHHREARGPVDVGELELARLLERRHARHAGAEVEPLPPRLGARRRRRSPRARPATAPAIIVFIDIDSVIIATPPERARDQLELHLALRQHHLHRADPPEGGGERHLHPAGPACSPPGSRSARPAGTSPGPPAPRSAAWSAGRGSSRAAASMSGASM